MKMRIHPIHSLFLLFVLLLLFPQGAAAFPGQEKILDPGLIEMAEKGLGPVRVIVTLGEDGQFSKGLALGASAGGKKEIKSLQQKVIRGLSKSSGRVGYRMENIPVISASVYKEGLKDLAAMDAVAFIEEDREMVLHTAQGISMMNPGGWREGCAGKGIAVAIVDTGVDYRHPALGRGSFPNEKVIGGYDVGENDGDPMDNQGHGTSCAGIAAGDTIRQRDYIGGVAPSAKIYALKISTGTGGIHGSGVLRAWDWCVSHQYDDPDHPIMVISTSIGTPMYHTSDYCRDRAYDMMAAVAKKRGIAIFVSSGNENQRNGISSPSCLQDTISVGAVYDADIGSPTYSGTCSERGTRRDQVTCYSNSAPILDILGPSNNAYTAALGPGYTPGFGGTSAACPYAAGVAALIQSCAKAQTGDYLDVDRLRQVMVKSGVPVRDPKSGISKPRIDIAGAMAAAGIREGGGGDGRDEDDEDGGEEGRRPGTIPLDQLRDILRDAKQQ